MRIFSGIYRWDGKRHGNRAPIAWFPGAYYLHIYEAEPRQPNITPLKPFLCIYEETGEGHSVSADPERFISHICDDFALVVERVLWVEKPRKSGDGYEVVLPVRSGRLGERHLYRFTKRLPTPAELSMINQFRQASATG